jgi:hypothetical protein
MKREAFLDELIKEAGISDMASSIAKYPLEVAKDAIGNIGTFAASPMKTMKDNASFIWDPHVAHDAPMVDKVIGNKWLQRYLGVYMPAKQMYDLAMTPGANTDPENWGTALGSTLGMLAVPLKGGSLGGTIASQMAFTGIGKYLGHLLKTRHEAPAAPPTKRQENVQNLIAEKYPDSSLPVY